MTLTASKGHQTGQTSIPLTTEFKKTHNRCIAGKLTLFCCMYLKCRLYIFET